MPEATQNESENLMSVGGTVFVYVYDLLFMDGIHETHALVISNPTLRTVDGAN